MSRPSDNDGHRPDVELKLSYHCSPNHKKPALQFGNDDRDYNHPPTANGLLVSIPRIRRSLKTSTKHVHIDIHIEADRAGSLVKMISRQLSNEDPHAGKWKMLELDDILSFLTTDAPNMEHLCMTARIRIRGNILSCHKRVLLWEKLLEVNFMPFVQKFPKQFRGVNLYMQMKQKMERYFYEANEFAAIMRIPPSAFRLGVQDKLNGYINALQSCPHGYLAANKHKHVNCCIMGVVPWCGVRDVESDKGNDSKGDDGLGLIADAIEIHPKYVDLLPKLIQDHASYWILREPPLRATSIEQPSPESQEASNSGEPDNQSQVKRLLHSNGIILIVRNRIPKDRWIMSAWDSKGKDDTWMERSAGVE
jgi:hypothetical protein